MKQSIRKIIQQFEEAKEKTAGLMHKLTAKATVLEKLKARIGMATALSAFLQLNELSDQEPEEDDLLKEGMLVKGCLKLVHFSWCENVI